MKNLLIATLLISIPFLSPAQSSQVVNEDIEIIEEFHSINVNSRYTVYLKQSNETKIEVRALKEILDISEFKVEDGVLNINIKRDKKNKSVWEQIDDIKIAPKLDVFVSMKEVNALNVYGNGKIITENSISSNRLDITLSGSGSLAADIKGGKLAINHSGGGLMKIKGYADHADVSLSGYGKIEGYELDLKSAKTKLTGSGDVEIKVDEQLEAFVYGDGTISFKGNTKEVTKKEYGLGKVERTY
ncbi:Putative auto-transporter adhesin, head GIN domain [Ekhidna lutea]|uniref:Putative auto-transporter adhesin, head GIN domain n=1 Tax=Ekhidna lutea TaxID=447679 RepID=A0A239LLH5_EKHLU|nr:head GIN domain-containing protein [Ekhidna lutea]SNT31225.1 Putative auto-transporter adhesin, head GIN domain [Ekhidna lutea]